MVGLCRIHVGNFFCFKINQVQKVNVKLTFTPTRTLAAFFVTINFFYLFLRNSFSKFLLQTLTSTNILENSVSSEFKGAWLTSLNKVWRWGHKFINEKITFSFIGL